jgi:membrane-bound metal-dependent hydrolase YbcI (DUF457 family)
MAKFKTHLAGSIITGLGISVAGFTSIGLNLTQAFAVFIVGSVGGILPDLDSDSGRPLTLLFGLISVLIPALLISWFPGKDSLSSEFLISYFVFSYFLINYVFCEIIKKFTIHRGIMHSIPFAIQCGMLGYLLFVSSGKQLAIIAGCAILIGCLVHLILDELNSFTFKFGFIPWLKRSSGTALKLKTDSLLTNIFIYSLVIMTFSIILLI